MEEEKKEEFVGTSEKKPSSVKDYGFFCDQNWKFRRRMEDEHYLEDGFNGVPSQGFFAVYDGHGGREAAVFASQNLHKILAEKLEAEHYTFDDPSKMTEIFEYVYAKTDEKMKDSTVPSHHGCTSITVLVTGTGTEKRQIFAANAGDAQAFLVTKGGKGIPLSKEHKSTDESEVERINNAGGFVSNGRVNSQIAITRSLGDHLMKEFIISDPFVSHEVLTEEHTHVIIACDGVWDVVQPDVAAELVLANNDQNATEISKKLLVKALQDGSTDNLSVIVLKL